MEQEEGIQRPGSERVARTNTGGSLGQTPSGVLGRVTQIKQNHTKWRLVITLINVLLVAMIACYHLVTNSDDLHIANKLLKLALEREQLAPFKTISFKQNCDVEENPLVVHLWPGTTGGCVCKLKDSSARSSLTEYRFLEPDCISKGISCAEKIRILRQTPLAMLRLAGTQNGTICYQR